MNTNDTIVILYHRGCRDGFAAAAVADLYLRDSTLRDRRAASAVDEGDSARDVRFFGLDPGKLLPDIARLGIMDFPPETQILSFDVSFSVAAYDLLKSRYSNVTVVDHHVTTERAFKRPDGTLPADIIYDVNYSGCVLAWRYFYPSHPVPRFLLYLQDRDLWQTTMEHSETVNEGLYATITYAFTDGDYHRPDFTQWRQYLLDDSWFASCLEIGEILLTQKRQELQFAKPNARKMLLTVVEKEQPVDYQVAVCNATTLVSDLGNLLAISYPDCHCALLYRIVGDDVWVSLRSHKGDNGGFDTTRIASYYGGGGHRNASGFSIKLHQFRVTPIPIAIGDRVCMKGYGADRFTVQEINSTFHNESIHITYRATRDDGFEVNWDSNNPDAQLLPEQAQYRLAITP